MRLCGEDCEQVFGHDDLMAFLRRADGVPTEVLDSLYQDELLVSCDPTDIEVPVSRLQTLRTLMRAFGYLEPPPPAPIPPCSQIS